MSPTYPKLSRREFINFIKKLNYQLEPKRGKGSHEFFKHKKYLALTIPTNTKEIDHYIWKNLENSISNDKEWILKKLKEYKFMK